MHPSRLIGAVATVAMSLAPLGASATMAATMKPSKPEVHKVHHVYVSGKIVRINAPAAMLTLSNGKTYRLVNAKEISKFKVGQWVRLRIG